MTLAEALALPYGREAYKCLRDHYACHRASPRGIRASVVAELAPILAALSAQSEAPPGKGGACAASDG